MGYHPLAWVELPPRARRILIGERQVRRYLGTTSACAENTPRSLKTVPGCGNYLRVRGTTSACAENTPRSLKTVPGCGNYLRVRGEYLRTIVSGFSVAELPPRARRILRPPPPHSSRIGTTSACAENTEGWPETLGFCWNYLRVRGEYYGQDHQRARKGELPPRARRIR